MAILSNLLVNGTSRLLGKLYCSDLDVSGTTSFAGVSATTLDVSGEATIDGTLILARRMQTAATSYKAPALVVGGLSTQKHIEYSYDCIQGKANANSASPVYINYYGGKVYLSNGYKVYVDNGTLVANTVNSDTGTFDDLNVVNTLRANRYSVQQLSNLGGAFYVSPTLSFPNSGTTLTVTKSSTALTLAINDSTLITDDLAGIVWTVGSKVKVSGKINSVVTGTMDGTITAVPNSNSHVLTVSVSGDNWNSVDAGTYNESQFSDLNVMVYQRKVGTYDYRVGIWLNCYDMQTETASMRIYGGTSSLPNVMLGNLENAGLDTVNGMTPTGWGLFAQNAFLHGHIVANAGKIGGFTLGTESMYSGDNFPNTDNFYLMPTGSQSTTYNIAGSGALSNWVMTSGTTFGVTKDGKIYATAGKIGGFTLSAAYMYGNKTAPAANNLFFMPAGTSSSYTVAGVSTTGWTITSGTTFGVTKAGAMYSTSGKIGGWTIGTSAIYNGVISMDDETHTGLYLGTDGIRNYNATTGNYVDIEEGIITAVGAHIEGSIYAESGKIAGFNISNESIWYGTNGTGSSNPGVYIGTHGIRVNGEHNGWRTMILSTGDLYSSSISADGSIISQSPTKGIYTRCQIDPTSIALWYGTQDATTNYAKLIWGESWDISLLLKKSFAILDEDRNVLYRCYYGMPSAAYMHQFIGDMCIRNNLQVGTSADPDNVERQIRCTSTGGTIYMFAQEGTRDNNSPNVGLWTSSGLLILKNLNTGYLSIDSKLTSSQDIRQLGWDGAVRRCVNSADGDGGRVAYVASGSSNAFSACGQFGTTGSTYVTRKVTMTTSDVRLKENIYNTQEKGLDLLNNVRLVSFDWKDTHEHKSIGIIADELEKLNPELVAGGGYDEDGNMDVKAIDTLQLLSYTIKAIQEQQAEIESLKKQLASMQQK